MSTVVANQWKNSDGTENYKCRAWVNFNGTGTVAIRASGNVSSITDNGVGQYTVNFTNAMPDTNYAAAGGCGTPGSFNNSFSADYVTARTTTSVGVGSYNFSAWADSAWFSVVVVR